MWCRLRGNISSGRANLFGIVSSNLQTRQSTILYFKCEKRTNLIPLLPVPPPLGSRRSYALRLYFLRWFFITATRLQIVSQIQTAHG